MAPAIYLALFLLFFPTVILAETRRVTVPLTRWRKEGWNHTLAANNIRQRYGHGPTFLQSRRSNRRAESVTQPIQVEVDTVIVLFYFNSSPE